MCVSTRNGGMAVSDAMNYIPPGPVSAAYLQDRSGVCAIMGPVGSAKTSTTVMKLARISSEQRRSPIDGVRYTKWMVVRDTYRNLNRTTVKTFKTWMPKAAGNWTGGGSDPAIFHMRARLVDQSIMDMLVEFVALGDNSIEDVARGWEGTGIWLNEADLLPPDVFSYLYGRCGRYPSKLHGGASWYGALADYNAPDTDNYLYSMFEELRPEGFCLFKQPGGRDPRAENLMNLPDGYYEKQVLAYMAQGRPDLVRRMIDNLYGYSRDGEPVYPEYRDDFHCAGAELQAVEGLPIKVSCDQGLHPAATLRQTMPSGQRRILEEIYCDTGAKGLAEEVRRVAAQRYPGFRLVGGLCDLAGGARDGVDGETWIDAFNRFMNFTGPERVRLAPTNAIDKCTSAVRVCLTRLVDGGQPGLIISNRCKVMRKGFNSSYCYKKSKQGTINKDKPVKLFPVSDVMNALEFDCMDEGGYEDIIGRARRATPWGTGKMFAAKMGVTV